MYVLPFTENVKLSISKESSSKEITKKNVVKQNFNYSSVVSSTAAPVENQVPYSADNPLGIKIKEITKPEEIRITDDKPKLFKPPTKAIPSSKELVNPTPQPTALPSPTPTPITPTNEIHSMSEDTNRVNESNESTSKEIAHSEEENISVSGDTTEKIESYFGSGDSEIPSLHLGISDENTLGDGFSNKNVRQAVKNTSDPENGSETTEDIKKEIGDGMSTSSATTESYPTNSSIAESSVVRVGNDVVIVKDSVNITLKGAAGLQQGEDIENDETRKHDVGDTTIVTIITEADNTKSLQTENGVSSPQSQEVVTTEVSSSLGDTLASAELVSDSSSDELSGNGKRKLLIGSPGKKSLKPKDNKNSDSYEVVEPDGLLTENVKSSSTEKPLNSLDQVFETVFYYNTNKPLVYEPTYYGITVDSFEGSSSPFDDDQYSSTSEPAPAGGVSLESTASPSVESSSHHIIEEEENSNNNDKNIEFPELPEDVSIHKTVIEERRISGKIITEEAYSTTVGPDDNANVISFNSVLHETVSKASSGDSSTTVGPLDLIKAEPDNADSETVRMESLSSVDVSEHSSTTSGPEESLRNTEDTSVKESHKIDNIQERSPGEPHLIPEWERTTTEIVETTVFNIEDATKPQSNSSTTANELEKIEEVKVSNELSSGEQNSQKKVSTTEKSIAANGSESELESSSSSTEHYVPDDDAESIKFRDSNEDNIFEMKFIEKPAFNGFDFINDFFKVQKNNWNS